MTAFRTPWDVDPSPEVTPPVPETAPPPAKRRGRRPAAAVADAGGGAGAGSWLYHHLTITGPADRVAAFARRRHGARYSVAALRSVAAGTGDAARIRSIRCWAEDSAISSVFVPLNAA